MTVTFVFVRWLLFAALLPRIHWLCVDMVTTPPSLNRSQKEDDSAEGE